MEEVYDAAAVEARRQREWREGDVYATPPPTPGRPDAYVKAVCPFTSGHIHVGHVRSYTIADAYARWRRMAGDAVLFSIGFDAFGLPAELAAIANEESPADWVQRSYEHMLDQFERMGFSFDWERVFVSSDEEQYKWSQWLFLAFLEAGLLYQEEANVDWCDSCQTTLASLQVEDGCCWRCNGPARLIKRKQWFLRISAYIEENERGIDAHADQWDKPALTAQRAILGRVDGVEVDLRAADGRTLTCFTEHPDAIGQARFVAISPRHPELESLLGERAEVLAELEEVRQGGWQRGDRSAESVPAIDTGVRLTAPNGAELPLVISPAVDGRYGPTAVLGIPAADESDGVIARRLAIGQPAVPPPGAGDTLGGSRSDNGRTSPSANGAGPGPRPAVRYRAGDFAISRQRSWGAPIPMVHCATCGEVPVAREDLPVSLPRDLKPTGEGNPLAAREDFMATSCPRCGGDARRETDTLDCHFDDLWMWLPTCVPKADRARQMFDHPECERWLPGAMLIHGADGGGYFFDQRVTAKALRDIGPLAHLADGEQFDGAVMHEMVTQDGRKMSKHLGNVVDPDDLMGRVGADTTRLAVLHGARPSRALNWTENAVQYCGKFLSDLWVYAAERLPGPDADEAAAGPDPDGATQRRERLEGWVATAAEKVTEDLERVEMQRAVKNAMRLFERIEEFDEKARRANRGELAPADAHAIAAALTVLAQLLTPFAPHVGEEIWIASGAEGPATWPSSGLSGGRSRTGPPEALRS
ncbi:MAG TPA: class I tRNA ligase family protein [Thermoleophilaceae bacterium]|nr:class I tRNA ligase family protein [Thermoleophilaceae bacterium]